MSKTIEYIDVLDEGGNKTGERKLRREIHMDGEWHLNVHVWIINQYDDLFLQKRNDDFYLQPHFLDVTMSGHVQSGHTSEYTAVKEAEEELSVQIPVSELEYIGRDKVTLVGKNSNQIINNEFHDIYIWRTQVNLFDFKFDTQEMKGLDLVTIEEFGRMVEGKDERLVPQWREYEMLLWYLGGHKA